MRNSKRKESARSGQAILETCLAMLLICLIFAGLVQVSQLFAAREILQRAATSGVRAKTVGLNRWMVEKVVNVAAIPNSGKLLVPSFTHGAVFWAPTLLSAPGEAWSNAVVATPSSEQYGIERRRIPSYLGSWNRGRAKHELDYSYWEDPDYKIEFKVDGNTIGDSGAPMLHVKAYQNYPLWTNWHESFYADDDKGIKLEADAYMENHYPLYIEDYNR
jgi:hypothetical protein